MTVTLTLTEAEAARVFYALQAEASEHSRKLYAERKNGALSVASGRAEILHETARDECLSVVRKIEAASE